jgi:hypothetical protein
MYVYMCMDICVCVSMYEFSFTLRSGVLSALRDLSMCEARVFMYVYVYVYVCMNSHLLYDPVSSLP